MELILALGFGALVAAGTYMTLARHTLRMVLGLSVIAIAINMLLFVAGGIGTTAPALIASGADVASPDSANPLPQALVLTAIVIGFALLAFALVLAYRAHLALRTVDTDAMREAEPVDEGGR
ncbi:MAG: NADH-quinone oxidoreductase subunit K [Pseudomonadota bacterium]